MTTPPYPLPFKAVDWVAEGADSPLPGRVRLLDQTLLPREQHYLETTDLETLFHAIRSLKVRGAPAIGVAAAMAAAAHAQLANDDRTATVAALQHACRHLATSRPTAVNLFWALDRMSRVAGRVPTGSATELKLALIREALAIRDEDAVMCRNIGEHGASLIDDGDCILTHCNAGALATSLWGTALAPFYVAHQQGKKFRVFADETRPLLQGARLTAWELSLAGIETTLLCDNAAASAMREKGIKKVFVGADRIATNGDTANKVGTYGVALLAKAHAIPFFVLAPSTTFDIKLKSGGDIPIEHRAAAEVTHGFGSQTAPDGIDVYTPAFDVTPAELISGIICEAGILRPPFGPAIRAVLS